MVCPRAHEGRLLRGIARGRRRRHYSDGSHGGFRSRGWPSVRTVLPAVLKELHYHTDAEGFVLVVDSNGSPPHVAGHETQNAAVLKCRLCQLRRIADEVQRQVRPRTNQRPLRIALGLAVPTIEAWLLCGVDPHVTEAAWANGLRDERGRMPYTKNDLKRQLYQTTHPSLAIETEAMKDAATRLSKELGTIEQLFPDGFGALFRSLRAWI